MKTFLLIISLSLLSFFAHAKIWRVNNVPGITADFTTAQAAHDGANANDTIYLESSPTGYGNLITTKKLTWIGLGYFLSQNPGLQFHNNSGMLGDITVNTGSDGSIFEINMAFNYLTINSCANIIFKRCYLRSNITMNGTVNHITITDCYLDLSNGGLQVQPNSPQFGFTFTNNIMFINYVGIQGNAYQVTFNNNTVITNGNNNGVEIDNAGIANNIFYNTALGGLYNPSYPSNVTNNLWTVTSNAGYVGSNGNIFAADPSTVFVLGSSPDARYKLVTGSPASGTGAGNVDMGAYGGADPYVVSVLPAVPTIYQLSVPANATGNSLPCTVSTRANN